MKTLYRTEAYRDGIEPIECVRETDKTVWVMESSGWGTGVMKEFKHPKVSEYARYHDSWEAAHAYLLRRAEIALEGARQALNQAQGRHGNIVGMKRPD